MQYHAPHFLRKFIYDTCIWFNSKLLISWSPANYLIRSHLGHCKTRCRASSGAAWSQLLQNVAKAGDPFKWTWSASRALECDTSFTIFSQLVIKLRSSFAICHHIRNPGPPQMLLNSPRLRWHLACTFQKQISSSHARSQIFFFHITFGQKCPLLAIFTTSSSTPNISATFNTLNTTLQHAFIPQSSLFLI